MITYTIPLITFGDYMKFTIYNMYQDIPDVILPPFLTRMGETYMVEENFGPLKEDPGSNPI